MSDDAEKVIPACERALKAARPFVLDGRGEGETERALELVDDALERAARYRDDHPDSN